MDKSLSKFILLMKKFTLAIIKPGIQSQICY